MNIRKATIDDAQTLSALNVDVQRIHANALPHIFKQPESANFALEVMTERLSEPSNHFFIAQIDGEAVGYIFARVVERPENPFMFAWTYIYIDQISVKPMHQKRGIGKLLIDEVLVLANAKGIETVALDTWTFNNQALSFFKKQGFVPFNERLWLIE
ncbi:MAG: GNAT family N-acetyltransferase [Anaerolineales bacterium]|nr:GNAT family N-acetyltransferase [Anaerolineales bacterium]MCA9929925.1 GNAT family N-acetyltransferase [Anaerolineales bacterium]